MRAKNLSKRFQTILVLVCNFVDENLDFKGYLPVLHACSCSHIVSKSFILFISLDQIYFEIKGDDYIVSLFFIVSLSSSLSPFWSPSYSSHFGKKPLGFNHMKSIWNRIPKLKIRLSSKREKRKTKPPLQDKCVVNIIATSRPVSLVSVPRRCM